jgi:ACS family hexuronate transporter-like MFS transporter
MQSVILYFQGRFFLNRTFGLELQGLAIPLIAIFVVADLGSVFVLTFLAFYKNRLDCKQSRSRNVNLLIIYFTCNVCYPD